MLFTNEWMYAYGCKCIYMHIRELYSSDKFLAITGCVAFYLVSKGSFAVPVITLVKPIWRLCR
jgi:hypothetical protein